MRMRIVFLIFVSAGIMAAALRGATAAFVAVGPTTVTPGTQVTFDVRIVADDPLGFDAADVIIGSNSATGIGFTYSAQWMAAFENVTPLFSGASFYAHDVFVGANTSAPVANGILLGAVTVDTTGMSEGSFDVRIDPAIDDGVSRVTLAGVLEPLSGSGLFTIECASADANCDGDVDLANYADVWLCLTGPSIARGALCALQDVDRDGDVDLEDVSILMSEFTGED